MSRYQLIPKRPTDLGLPDKFDHWRDGQAEAAEQSILNDKRFDTTCAATGFGKTVYYMALSILEGGRTVFVVQNKALQNQLMDDFGSIGLKDIRGKSNYVCGARPDWTCREGHSGGCTMKGSNACPYSKAYNEARTSPLVVTNYKFWIAIHRYGLGLGTVTRVVFDEAQSCPDELSDSLSTPISFHEMEMLKSDFPPMKTRESADAWKQWATRMRILSQEAFNNQFNKIRAHGCNAKNSWMQDLYHYKNMVQKFSTIALMKPGDWIWEEKLDFGYQFDPIRFGRYAESRLFLKIPKVMMTSATIREKTVRMLGVRPEDIHFFDSPSSFPSWRSPIYSIPTMRVDQRSMGNYQMLAIRADQIFGPRLSAHRNGIVLVTSFEYRNTVYNQSAFKRQMISHWDGDPSSKAVSDFKKRGGILISPSISTGFDFPDDECRFTILTKIPWQPKTKIIKAREEIDKEIGPYHAMQKIIQFSGRGFRSETDWCENFILDDHFSEWFYQRYRYMTPRWFQDRYSELRVVPKMLVMN